MKRTRRLRLLLPLAALAAGGAVLLQLGGPGIPGGRGDALSATIPPAAATAGALPTADPGTSAPEAAAPTGTDEIESALGRDGVVVVVVYLPGATLDALQVTEARRGAQEAQAGFLSIDASREASVAGLAETYGVRTTPAVLVLGRGPQLVSRFDGFADHLTVAQAAATALQTD